MRWLAPQAVDLQKPLPCRDGGIRTHDPLTPSSQVAQRHAHARLPRSLEA